MLQVMGPLLVEAASVVADFALDMLASAHRTGMNLHSADYEKLRLNTVARVAAAVDAYDIINRTDMRDKYLDRYNEIISS